MASGIGTLFSRDKPKNEGGLSADIQGSESDDVIPGVTTEARDGRVHVWIEPRFSVTGDDTRIKGLALSLEGFEAESGGFSNKPGKALDIHLRLEIGSFILEIPAEAYYEAEGERKGVATSIYKFSRLDSSANEALRRFIRAHLMGHMVTVDDLVRSQDSPTGDRATRSRSRSPRKRSDNPIRRTFRTFINLIFALTALVVIVGFGSVVIMERLTVVHSAFASVSAPRIEMTAPEAGQVFVSGPGTGEFVSSGSVLARMPRSGTEFESPCECLVTYAIEDRSWVRRGDPIYYLARSSADDLRVEMLIPLLQMQRLHRGQAAYIRWPETDELIVGEIETISLEGPGQPRAGFPERLRSDDRYASVIVAPSTPLQPDMIGQPIEAFVRTDIPLIDRVVRYFEKQSSTDMPDDGIESVNQFQQNIDSLSDQLAL